MTFMGGGRACLCVDVKYSPNISITSLIRVDRGFKFSQLETSTLFHDFEMSATSLLILCPFRRGSLEYPTALFPFLSFEEIWRSVLEPFRNQIPNGRQRIIKTRTPSESQRTLECMTTTETETQRYTCKLSCISILDFVSAVVTVCVFQKRWLL